jgi:DMSO/TMAO reductase YedYZ molybdopterin-dependent catalytic subunit
VALADVLAAAGVSDDAVEMVFGGADTGCENGVPERYERSLPVSVAQSADGVLAYALNGAPLPPQHGYPLRLVVPGWYGMTNVKWLTNIAATGEPFDGYHQTSAYRIQHDEADTGVPVTRMLPRALMVPPGVPEFFTRTRVVPAGHHTLYGRAWSGAGAITRVEVSTDDGATWTEAGLGRAVDVGVWQEWTVAWQAKPGATVLCCRATDSAGNTQPLTPAWNMGGYVNNAVQRVAVEVR